MKIFSEVGVNPAEFPKDRDEQHDNEVQKELDRHRFDSLFLGQKSRMQEGTSQCREVAQPTPRLNSGSDFSSYHADS